MNSVPFITGMLGLLHECHKQTRQCGNVFRPTRQSERLLTHDDLILIDFKTFACKAPIFLFDSRCGGEQNRAPPPRQPIRRCGAERGEDSHSPQCCRRQRDEVRSTSERCGLEFKLGAGCVMDEVSCDARRCNIDVKATWSCCARPLIGCCCCCRGKTPKQL